jgi:glucose-1-phosphate adenylyltransferase
VERSIIGEGTEVYGEVHHSVIGTGVTIGKGTVVRDSIIMKDTYLGDNVSVSHSIIAECCKIGNNVQIGVGEFAKSKLNEKIYNADLAVIGEGSVIPDNVRIGKNCAISGVTEPSDYKDGLLESGDYIMKEGEDA